MSNEDPRSQPRVSAHRFVAETSPLGSEPRGLLVELMEDGVLRKDLVTPEHTYQVETRFQCDEQVGMFRCTVSCDGAGISQPPWDPVFLNFAQEFAAKGAPREAREEMARRALQAHLKKCTRVGQALEQHGSLVKRAGLPRFVLPVLGVAALILGTVLAVWLFKPELLSWQRVTKMFAARERTEDRPEQAVEPTAASVKEVEELAEDELEAKQEVGQEVSNLPSVPLARPQPVDPPDRRPRMTRPQSVARAKSKPVQQETQSSISVQERAPAATQQEPVKRISKSQPEPSTPTSGAFWPVTSPITPPDHSLVRLLPGEQVYPRSNVHWVDVPPVLRSLRCVTTREADGETKQVISMTLTESSRLVILFDRQIKRRPTWLATFRQSSDTLTAVDPDRKDTSTYLVFEQDYPAGFVELGKNTAANRFTKRLRTASRRSTLMYLVCFTKASKASAERR